jgi:Zn-finger nucleic acid-binding protein
MACPSCSARQLVEIALRLQDSQVTLHSCSRCDTRWWDQDGEQVLVDHVLQLATVRR